jgi:hypothetical protein
MTTDEPSATMPQLNQNWILQEAAEDTEELVCPLITRINTDGMPHDPRPSASSAEHSGAVVVAHSDMEQLAKLDAGLFFPSTDSIGVNPCSSVVQIRFSGFVVSSEAKNQSDFSRNVHLDSLCGLACRTC